MRLGQLARKLSLNPAEIVAFLGTKNIQIEAGSNTRLENDQVNYIVQHFAPALAEDLMAVEESATEEISPAEVETTTEKEAPAETAPPEVMTHEADSPVKEEVLPEVIKAPKVELPGLRVIGKIDLPEPKKKTPVVSTEEIQDKNATGAEAAEAKPSVRKMPYPKRERTAPRMVKNPIALQREKEAEELEKRRKEKAIKDKEKRTLNYLKKVKSAPTKPAKMLEEPVIEMTDEAEKPKTWLGRLKRWFTT